MTRQQIAEAVVAASSRLLTGFGFDVTVQIKDTGKINKQMIADSMADLAKSAAGVLISTGIQMGTISK